MIIRAAIMVEGLPVSLPRPKRHHDIIRKYAEHPAISRGIQGFIDDREGFVDREVARSIVVDENQVLRFEKFHHKTKLFSEDLW